MTNQIILDPSIRDWVLIPIVFVMILVGFLRHYVTKLLKSAPIGDVKGAKLMNTLVSAQRLQRNGSVLVPSSYLMRKSYYIEEKVGVLKQKVGKSAAANPMSNPNGMMDMMKGQMAMIVPNIVMMAWINNFFSGFVLVKIPFPLTEAFKTMMQKGVESLESLDVSYVSSLSWYFIVMFGLRGFYSLLLGDDNETDESKLMQQQMGAGMMQQQGFDFKAAYSQEVDNLLEHKYEFSLYEAEKAFVR